ncbi:MAG TPA: type II CAAX endopeptidase family protein [Xanthomonadaceae bacterium]|nr:type II CAAX endopeptidase family protein [Xanthomonadaceae bacterium]
MERAPANRQAAFEIGAVLAVIVLAWAICRLWLYPALGIGDNTPVIMRPIGGFLVAWWLLRRRGERWSGLGLCRHSSWTRAIIVGVGTYGALTLLSPGVASLLAAWLPATPQPADFLAYIHGHLAATLPWLGIAWVVGGFCEEALFRGFLLNRLATLFGGGPMGLAFGVLGQAMLFGSLHFYGGAVACAHAAFFGLMLGIAYLAGGRNLLPLMFVHGMWDTVEIWGVYTG